MADLVWSYSMLDVFETCPKKWHSKYILREKEAPSPALELGNYVHKSIEDYLTCKRALPDDIPGSKLVEQVKSQFKYGFAELGVGVDNQLKPAEFFGKNVWGRGKADAVIMGKNTLWCGDWKTGKRREKEDQLKILSLFLFKRFPQVREIKSCNIWLNSNEMGDIYTFKKEDEPQMWASLLTRLNTMYNAVGTSNAETMKPSYLCGYCPVKTCRFNKS